MRRYRFGVFEADARSGELTRSGRLVPVAPQPFRALLLLLERPGEVVTREEMRRALWDEATFVEFDQSLNFTMARIRSALGDSARSPRFLETLPRRGYRFVAPVERMHEGGLPPAAAPAPRLIAAAGPPRRMAVRARAAVVGLLALTSIPWSASPRHEPYPAARAAFRRGQDLADAGRRRQSIVEFRRAVSVDPSFAEAHFAIASTYVTLAEAGELAAAAAFPIARVEAERALELEEVADSHLVLGSARFFYDWDWDGARREFERAAALEPGSSAPLAALARLLSAAGDHRAAIDAIARAEAKSPSCDLIVHEAGWIHYRARRYAESIRKFDRSASLGPPHFTDATSWNTMNRYRVLLVHVQMGAPQEAAEDAYEIARLSGASAERQAALRALPPEEATRRMLRNSLGYFTRRSEREYVSPVRVAEVHVALGEREEAMRWLSRAARERAPDLVYSIGDPLFDRLRGQPAFEQLVARLRGPADGQRRGAGGAMVADALPEALARR